ncbi:contractile injection system tape measure protein [Vibrio sp. PP-XX7]
MKRNNNWLEADQIAQTSQKTTGHHLAKNAAAETALNRGGTGAAYAALGLSPDEIEWTGLPFALKRQAEKAYTKETERVRQWLNILPIKQTMQQITEHRQRLEEQVTDLPQFTMDGGLVLLAPFLPTLFERAALLSQREDEHGKMDVAFSTPDAQLQAYSLLVHLLGDACSGDYCGTANILCGYDLYDAIEPVSLSDEEKQETERLLESAVARWDALKGMPVASFQSLFLQRRAECHARESGYLVQVEKQTIDILMRKLPWGLE